MTKELEHREAEETIVPVATGFGRADQPTFKAKRSYEVVVTGVIAVVVLILAVGVFFALPRWLERRDVEAEQAARAAAEAPPPETPAAPAAPVLSAEELAALQEKAESQLADLLKQRAELEARSVASWAAEEWAAYQELLRLGDDALLAQDYQEAVTQYSAADEMGTALLERSAEIVASASAAGDAALAAGDAALAREQFELVLGIEPTNAAAVAGRGRAERLPEVIALMQQAERERLNGALEQAAALYRQALDIDAEWAPASTALAEVSRALANAEFEGLLSQGFAALAEDEYEAAREHFRAALKLQPGSASAADGLAQVEQEEKLDTIALAQARALAFERRELWHQAIEVYSAALEADSTLEFATSGLERARARGDLDSKLENLIMNPQLLLTDSVLADARRLADQARVFVEPDTRIGTQVAKLDELIAIASTPLPVMLESDALTEVTVYRVGELGTFATREIQVRPGTYTAVGSRDGYRDVRETFTVLPGRATPSIRVVCSEPI